MLELRKKPLNDIEIFAGFYGLEGSGGFADGIVKKLNLDA